MTAPAAPNPLTADLAPTPFDLPPLAFPHRVPGSTILLFVRHAEVRNPRNVVYGRLPRFGLSPRGRTQAERVAAFLADLPLAAIYTSPLLRARQTAAAIAARHPHLRVHQASALLEVRTSWQGTPNKEVPKGTSFYVDRRANDDESIDDVLARLQAFVRRLLRRHTGEIVVCVGHADPIAILTLAAAGTPVTPKLLQQPVAPARGAVTIFEYPTPTAAPILSYANPQDPEPQQPGQYTGTGHADGATPADAPAAEAAAPAPGATIPGGNGTETTPTGPSAEPRGV
ncbi:MAG: histidine phosphatase family protein [Chloroflexi bacterium]|nr:histidine phosphatase family protein [Chloroflexota bacterium]